MRRSDFQTHTFARDLRTHTEFVEAVDANREKLSKCSKRVRLLLDQLRTLAGDPRKGVQSRLKDVAEALDGSS